MFEKIKLNAVYINNHSLEKYTVLEVASLPALYGIMVIVVALLRQEYKDIVLVSKTQLESYYTLAKTWPDKPDPEKCYGLLFLNGKKSRYGYDFITEAFTKHCGTHSFSQVFFEKCGDYCNYRYEIIEFPAAKDLLLWMDAE